MLIVDGIYGFNSDYHFLSNFHPATVEYNGLIYPTTEHAYQASKTLNHSERLVISNLPFPALAKKAGKRVKMRDDWDSIKVSVMRELLDLKFQHPYLKQQLIDTGDLYLEETNYWRDTFWGVCNGKGNNVLGNLLMELRDRLNNA